VDRKDGDAIVAAIRSIEKLAVRVHFDLCGVIGSGKVLRQGRDGLQALQGARGTVVRERGDEGSHFAERVGERPVGVECKMTWARVLGNWSERWVVRCEGGFGRI